MSNPESLWASHHNRAENRTWAKNRNKECLLLDILGSLWVDKTIVEFVNKFEFHIIVHFIFIETILPEDHNFIELTFLCDSKKLLILIMAAGFVKPFKLIDCTIN